MFASNTSEKKLDEQMNANSSARENNNIINSNDIDSKEGAAESAVAIVRHTEPQGCLLKDGTLVLPLPTEMKPSERPYPKKVLFIVANEFCERFSYYGLRTVLVLYFKGVLGFNDANSTVSFHLFATLCYLTPILGAILGDSVWGKFKTIFYLSIVYFLGELVLVISSIFWDLGTVSVSSTFIGLLMIGIGTGGIKPCVSALGGDQFLPNEEKRRQAFFSLFYGAINLGSLISMFITPILRSDFHCVQRTDCYPYAFGLPCLLMFAAIVVFLLAKDQYNLVALPEKNIIIAFCQCVWLALERKISGKKLPDIQANNQITQSLTDNTSRSSLSSSSNEDVRSVVVRNNQQHLDKAMSESNDLKQCQHGRRVAYSSAGLAVTTNKRNSNHNSDDGDDGGKNNSTNHWLYLASDRFDRKSIGEFKLVLGILLLFVPLPVYWCLYDQQSSLWTLQATRMDGRLFNSGFVIQPDQMSIANPLLLLTAIPIFELCIYPGLNRLNLLTKPIQRITTGGLLAALTFVLSAMIEIRIQESLPPVEPYRGQANLILVNGLNDCFLIMPTISYVATGTTNYTNNTFNGTAATVSSPSTIVEGNSFSLIEPLNFKSVDILSAKANFFDSYQLKFKLSNENGQLNDVNNNNKNSNNNGSNFIANKRVGCPFDSQLNHELNIGPLPDKSVKLLYLEQGNGKLAYRLFNESLDLPQPGKARVRLLYEFFGSSAQAEKRQFYLVRLSSLAASKQEPIANPSTSKSLLLKFNTLSKDGQVIISDHMDVNVPENGEMFVLRTSDNLIGGSTASKNNHSFLLEPGTRNLIIAHQKDATTFEVRQQLLQDNQYRISLLWQLGPYLLISISEVMFSITGLEFSYSIAPDNMKSVILAAWSLTTAFGNILTVAVESMHLFSDVTHDFLFYACIMGLDMVLFAVIGFYYNPQGTGQ